MNTVSFIVIFVFIVIATVLGGTAMAQLHSNNPNARGTLTAGFGLGLAGIVLGAMLFGFLSI